MPVTKTSRWSQGNFRANVAVLLRVGVNQFVSCYRPDVNAWQCVQGGLENADDTPEQGVLRELTEELGVSAPEVQILARSKVWRRYRFPHFVLKNGGTYIGQDQLWYLAELSSVQAIDLSRSHGEFSKVEVWSLQNLIAHYAGWKKPSLADFCRELGL